MDYERGPDADGQPGEGESESPETHMNGHATETDWPATDLAQHRRELDRDAAPDQDLLAVAQYDDRPGPLRRTRPPPHLVA